MKIPLTVEENTMIGNGEVVILNSTPSTPPINSPRQGNWYPLMFNNADKLQSVCIRMPC